MTHFHTVDGDPRLCRIGEGLTAIATHYDMGERGQPATEGGGNVAEDQREAPNFTAETTQGTINFHDWIGDGWAILFSHPKDFTPVCTTELGYMAGLKPEFDKRNTKIIGLSVDPVDNHAKWAKDIEETQGHAVNYPMIGDPSSRSPQLYDMLPEGAGDYLGGPHRRGQRHGALGVRHRPGQEDQGDADLPDEHRPQFRRGAAPARFAAS